MNKITSSSNPKGTLSLLGAGLAAFAASICCVGPLVLLSLGISGIWIGGLSALEAYRPVFMAFTVVFLGFAFYRVYRRPKTAKIDGSEDCGCPVSKKRSKFMLWGVTFFIAAMYTFPYVAPLVLVDSPGNGAVSLEKVVLDVDNMTCASCTVTVSRSLTQIEGVAEARVTLTPPEAVVFLDPSKVSVKDLMTATANAGYPSTVR